MGRPYQEKFADVRWEVNEEHLNAWKEGKTGVPIVDAGMRQLNTMGELLPTYFYILRHSAGTAWGLGWMHNRARMVVAMYLTKDLMLDWRLGERVRIYVFFCAVGVNESYICAVLLEDAY